VKNEKDDLALSLTLWVANCSV